VKKPMLLRKILVEMRRVGFDANESCLFRTQDDEKINIED